MSTLYKYLALLTVVFVTLELFFSQTSHLNSFKGNVETTTTDESLDRRISYDLGYPGDTSEDLNYTRVKWIKKKIEKGNQAASIYNQDKFASLQEDDLVVVVQVHNRLDYLKHLVASLAKSKHVEDILLIFSHDVYDEEINSFIRNITFCKVLQIYFPYSIEAHPDEFPGQDPKDCPRDVGVERAKQLKCQNTAYPDKYGHYREPKYTQLKHHWWWKLHHVFRDLKATANFTGLVVFLEEDHYTSEDFIHVAKLMILECYQIVGCKFVGLGWDYKKIRLSNSDEFFLSRSISNLGLAFDRQTYLEVLLPCIDKFCNYDDYNWDWSLNYCLNEYQLSAVSKFSRVFHIGQCGVHVHNKNCDGNATISKVEHLMKGMKLFPQSMKLNGLFVKKLHFKENGGWGDQRDIDLCIEISKTARS